jgi:hypothetical protein
MTYSKGLDPASRPDCEHGPRVRKGGISERTGKPWAAFMCPAPRGDGQCPPEWADSGALITAAIERWAQEAMVIEDVPVVAGDDDEPPF